MRPTAVPLALCVVLAGCTVQQGIEQPPRDDSHVDPTTPIQRYLAADFRAEYVSAVCDWFLGCAATIGSIFADRSSCQSLFGFSFDQGVQEGGDVSDPLLFRVDPAKAALCVQAVKGRTCAQAPSFEDDPTCVAAFVGRLNDGECCDGRGGCAPGMVCEIDPSSEPEVGYCTAQGTFGETCFVQQCAPGTSCQRLGNLQTCLVSLGLGSGEACDYTFDCDPALACQYVPGGTQHLCLLRPDVGDFCTRDVPCAQGLYCLGGFIDPRCSATPGVGGDGCQEDANCGAGLSCLQEVCDTPGAVGEPCSNDDVATQCEPSLDCVDGICGHFPVPVAIGDPCHPDGPSCPGALDEGECAMGPTGYTCVAPLQEHDPCGGSIDRDCDIGRGLFCDPATSACVVLPKDGEACPLGLCQPIFTVTCVGAPGSGVCHPRKQLGSACTPVNQENILTTECAILTVCRPDPDTQQNVCTRVQQTSQAVCQ